MGIGLHCGLVFLCRGFGCSAFAVVSSALVVGSRSVLVLFVPRGGGVVCLNVSARSVLVFWPSRLVFVCVRRWSFAACAAVSFLYVVGWCLMLVLFLRLGFGLLRVRWFRIVFSLSGEACWSTQAKIGNFA